VAVVLRTDPALRLNVHLHVLALDGVYVRYKGGKLVFHALGVLLAQATGKATNQVKS
jgi:hypothetical protein